MVYQNSEERTYSRDAGPKVSLYEYLYVLILVIFAGHANKLVLANSIDDTPVALIFLVVLSGILALRWKITIDRQFLFFTLGFFAYFIAISVKYGEIQPKFFLTWFFQFFIVYAAVRSLKFNLFKIYELIIFYLAIIGLFLWVVQSLMGGDNLYGILRNITPVRINSNVSGDGLNFFIYSVQPTYNSLIYSNFLPRNCGFAWEPGGFSVFLSLAIFCNMFINKTKAKVTKRFWVFAIALISTQSTTGYLLLMVILLYYFYSKESKIVFYLFPVILAAVVSIFSLPFMTNKIVRLINETNEIDAMVVRSIGKKGEAFNPQRFSSLMITMIDFRNNPVFGLGGHVEDGWTAKIGARISPITGLGNLLAQFGLVGCLFFFISALRSSFYFSNYLDLKIKFLFFFLILFISISYTLIFFPLVMCFWMFRLFVPNEIKQKEIPKEELALASEEEES
jgi:hypothetical protein